ncbi:MAG: glutaminase A [Acetobacterales bacterium]
MHDLQDLLHQAHALGKADTGKGAVARYIPELSKADPSLFGLSVCYLDGRSWHAGDVDVPFTLQSVSKVFSFALALRERGMTVFERMSCEPSGDTFHSIVRLEEEKGAPRNPYINAGAIKVSSSIPGNDPEKKVDALRRFMGRACPGWDFPVDEAVRLSESRTGFRNRALANFMAHHGVIQDPAAAVETYFRQCAVQVTARSLAQLGLFLANKGCVPGTDNQIVSVSANRIVVSLMATCGLYDEVGHFAMTTGVPAKSGVSGGILAVVPGRMTIAAYGPALGAKGNSIAGMRALAFLSAALELSVYA